MADTFYEFVSGGNPLSASELEEAKEIVKEIKRQAGDTARMTELGVKWVIGNPLPLGLPAVGYKR